MALKHKVVISLLIYQGLTSAEIIRLTVDDVDLERGEVYIKGSRKLNERTLKLKQNQILLFYKYLQNIILYKNLFWFTILSGPF